MTSHDAFELGKRAGTAAKHGDWALVRHLKGMVPNDNGLKASYNRGYASVGGGAR